MTSMDPPPPPPGSVPPEATPPGDQPWYREHATLLTIIGLAVVTAIVVIVLVWILDDGSSDEVSSETIPTSTTSATTTTPATTTPATTTPATTTPATTVPPTAPPTTPAPTTPPTTPATTTAPTTPDTTVPTTNPPVAPADATVGQVLRDNPDQFGTFWQWIVDAGAADDFDDPGDSYTIFAPTNTALEGITPPTDPDELEALIDRYVVEQPLSTAQVFDGQRTEIDAEEGTIPVDQANMTVGGATIVHPDLEATGDPNGFVHGIDRVFTP